MKVGILDLLSMPSSHWLQIPYRALLNKQYAAIMPQAIAVWCRQLGYETHYATYYGQGDPLHALPDDLDVVFVSSFTHVSPLAYALARAYRKQGALTVIGGPHARSFPEDCQRFFDLVVKECDKSQIADILAGAFERGSQISSDGSLVDLPTVEERWPYIQQAAFWRGRPYFASTVPLLASTGCPYHCDFCIDWESKYRPLPSDRLQADLAFLAKHHPRLRITFHDPNLAVGWDSVLDELERIPPGLRSPTVVESSLASLKGEDRLQRIRDTRCQFICVGIESWSGYSEKAGAGHVQGLDKVPVLVDRLRQVAEYVPYLQGSFVFGLDVDQGDEPVEATKQFITDAPFVWPAVNIPQPFGHTPLYNDLLRDERLLTTMPYYFYQMPFLVTVPKHYDTVTYFEKVIEIHAHATTPEMIRRRLKTTRDRQVQALHVIRSLSVRQALKVFRRTLAQWQQDHQLLAFHHRETTVLPEVYEQILRTALGRFSELLTREDLTPLAAQPT